MKSLLFTSLFAYALFGYSQNEESIKAKKIYLTTATTFTHVNETKSFSAFSNEKTKTYSNNTGYSIGIGYIIPLEDWLAMDISSNYSTQGYRVKETANAFISSKIDEEFSLLDLSVNARISPWSSKLHPYFIAGIKYARMLSANKIGDRSGGTVAHFEGDVTDTRNQNLLHLTTGLGLEYNIEWGSLFVASSFNKGLNGIVIKERRYSNSVLVGDLQHVDSDITLNSILVSLGVSINL